jgi:hypothetical protein
MSVEPEKMDVLTKLSEHLDSRNKNFVTIPQTQPIAQTTSGNFFPSLYLSQTIIQSRTHNNRPPLSDMSARKNM